MGAYLNPSNDGFQGDITWPLYVDKTGLIRFTNSVLGHSQLNRIVVSRPRRFGKSMALSMLCAYYSRGCDSRELFHSLAIESDPTFEQHLNKHNVIRIDVQHMYYAAKGVDRLKDFSCFLSEILNEELARVYPEEVRGLEKSLELSLPAITAAHKAKFIFLVDEWDVLYRDARDNLELQEDYTNFLLCLFKGLHTSYSIDLVYMTGILPIPAAVLERGLNNFQESSMMWPGKLAPYFGFTEAETAKLCAQSGMSLQEIRDRYDGYPIGSAGSVLCPWCVTQAVTDHAPDSYWIRTASSPALFAVLNSAVPVYREAVKKLLAGVRPDVDDISNRYDLSGSGYIGTALKTLIHLGYLAYRQEECTVSIPNQEVLEGFLYTLSKAENNPAHLLFEPFWPLVDSTLCGNADAVAEIIRKNHDLYSSADTYDSETDLFCVLLLSYWALLGKDYISLRELPAGKGFADILLIPRRPDQPGILAELKWDNTAGSALRQFKEGRYTGRLSSYPNVILVELTYEKGSSKEHYREHRCTIELLSQN